MEKSLAPSSVNNIEICVWVARELKIQAVIFGKIAVAGDSLSIQVTA